MLRKQQPRHKIHNSVTTWILFSETADCQQWAYRLRTAVVSPAPTVPRYNNYIDYCNFANGTYQLCYKS